MKLGVGAHRAALVAALVLLLVAPAAAAKSKEKKKTEDEPARIEVQRWLVLGPVAHPLPLFHDAGQGGYDPKKLLDETILQARALRPREGESLAWFAGPSLTWTARAAGAQALVDLRPPAEQSPAVAWAAVWLEVDRWCAFELSLAGAHPRRAWLDGRPLASGGTGGPDEEVKSRMELTTGKHLLLVETVRDPQRDADWAIGASLSTKAAETAPVVDMDLDPERPVNLEDVLDPPSITSLAVSPDGREAAVAIRRVVPGTDETESWIEIRATADGTPAESWRGGVEARQVAWSPDGRYISYLAGAPGAEKDDDASALFLHDRKAGRTVLLLESVERLDDYLWSPGGDAIVYSATVKAEKDERGVKLVRGLMDRWAYFRDKTFLHLVTVPGGARRRLTAGDLSTAAAGFSPAGDRLLFTRQVERPEERPYTFSELWELDLASFTARKLREFGWLNGAIYSPDGERILIVADATAFGDAGEVLPGGTIPNSYDVQLFLWSPSSDEVEAITRDFDPSVQEVLWSRADGKVYFLAEDADFVRLYRYDPDTRAIAELETGGQKMEELDLAHAAPLAAVLDSSPWVRQRLVAVDLASGAARDLKHPADDWFADVRGGGLEEWSFDASSGRRIPGRIYLPPDFDASRKYPAIVYYYGGTSPVTREFGGRYPKEWWAANGYVVYVLQPSGATGFGQAWSATHVNDWGKVASQEIIEGTRAFLAAHPYVDPARVGCIGASYGGFMTMLLSTQTDLFAAAVSHAGISSLASYWGEGYWGALYSAVASAEAFPWNRRDVYVDQSPLFRADRNRVPILLTHGSADTNVPVGESDQFFVALKLLGKEVEYLQIEGQNHLILEHKKRAIWSSSIVAWFDRWLKGQPEWWNALYPSGEQKAE